MNKHKREKKKRFCGSLITIGKKLYKTLSHLVYSSFWVEIWAGLSFIWAGLSFIGAKSVKDTKIGFIL